MNTTALDLSDNDIQLLSNTAKLFFGGTISTGVIGIFVLIFKVIRPRCQNSRCNLELSENKLSSNNSSKALELIVINELKHELERLKDEIHIKKDNHIVSENGDNHNTKRGTTRRQTFEEVEVP